MSKEWAMCFLNEQKKLLDTHETIQRWNILKVKKLGLRAMKIVFK